MEPLPKRELPLPPGPRAGISMTGTSWLYELWFMFLRISPSYRLASLRARGRLRTSDDQLPSDIDVVQRVYNDLGNVYYLDFEEWWYGKAQLKFGHDNALPMQVLGLISNSVAKSTEKSSQISEYVQEFIADQRPAAANPAVAIFGVPLYADPAACIAAFIELLDEVQGHAPEHIFGMPYRLQKTRRKHRDLLRLVQLVWLRGGLKRTRAAATAGHRVMTRLGLTTLNRTTPAKARSQESIDQTAQKNNANIAMQTRLREAYRIAENAARGIFPSEEPLTDERTWNIFIGDDLNRLIRKHLRFDAMRQREHDRKTHPGMRYHRATDSLVKKS